MTPYNSDQDAKRKRAEEAAHILRRLDLDPDDPTAMNDREAFIARGPAEKATLEKMAGAFDAAPKALRQRDRRYSFALLGALLASLFFAYEPLRLWALADHSTREQTAIVSLSSGDIAVLDAATAIQDNTQNRVRSVAVLTGAAFFDVDTTGQRFVVQAGDVRAEAIGTEFEVSRVRDHVLVSVAEGRVSVTHADQTAVLEAGERLRIAGGQQAREALSPNAMADWRQGMLTMDGMTFGDVARVIGRRLSGRTVVISSTLAREPMVGVLDISLPEDALRTLAATASARVLRAPGFATVFYAQ